MSNSLLVPHSRLLALNDLLGSAEGVRLLRSERVFTSEDEFRGLLTPPAKSTLAAMLGAGAARPIYGAQQLYIDYRQSVVSKLLLLSDLERHGDLFPFFLWVDTDRCGSDKLSAQLDWPLQGRNYSIRVSPKALDSREARFAPIDTACLRDAINRLGAYLAQSPRRDRSKAQARYAQLRELFWQPSVQTLSEFNRRVTSLVLADHLGLSLRSVILSDLIGGGAITEDVNLFINHLHEVVEVFNRAVESLLQQGIDPHVKPLAGDYLPLNYACRVDGRRLRLTHQVEGHDHFAVTHCVCGADYRFWLGRGSLSVAELAQTGRWSPDVCLPIFLNDLVSGCVVGKSSGMYGLVLNAVARKVLKKTHVPMLVPQSLCRRDHGTDEVDSLMYAYLTAFRPRWPRSS